MAATHLNALLTAVCMRRYEERAVVRGLLGSYGFIAPEVLAGQRHRPAMDMFSLGVLLFVMLVRKTQGRRPAPL